jgi:mRNA interferase MazF
VRPALVILCDFFNSAGCDAVFVFITSMEHRTKFDVRISNENPSFHATGLKVPSTFRVSKLMALQRDLVKRRLGYADRNILERVESCLRTLLNLTNP